MDDAHNNNNNIEELHATLFYNFHTKIKGFANSLGSKSLNLRISDVKKVYVYKR
jgi:hypothetical protein